MPVYEVSSRTTLVTATIAAALCALRAGGTRPVYVREIHLFGITAPTTSGGLGLIRSTALGTGTLTSVTPVSRDPNAATPGATLITNWGTAAPTNGGAGSIFRRFTQPVSIGNGVIWTFDYSDPLIIPASGATSELCVCNTIATAPGTFDCTFILEE